MSAPAGSIMGGRSKPMASNRVRLRYSKTKVWRGVVPVLCPVTNVEVPSRIGAPYAKRRKTKWMSLSSFHLK